MTIQLSMKLHENLKKLMKIKKVSLVALAKEVGVPQSTIHGWINGAQPRNIIELNKIAKYFGLDIHRLCFGEAHEEILNQNEKLISEFDGVALILKRIKR